MSDQQAKRLDMLERVVRKAEALMGRWEPALDPRSEVALLLREARAALEVEG